jgi:hypothetical protein
MDITFYDLHGNPTAYTEDGEHIYLFSGKPVAYIDHSSVYSYDGRHLGRYENGWIRDNHGSGALFTAHASGGPTKPMKQLTPIRGIKGIRPIKSIKQLKPLRAIDSFSWSECSGPRFFEP